MDFNQISSSIQRPGVYNEFDFTGALPGLPRPVIRVLLAGQKLAAGSAVAGTLYKLLGYEHARTIFGTGSQVAGMAKGWFDNNKNIEVWGIGLADAGGSAAATGTFAYTGTATAAGSITEMVCGQRIKVGVTVGMTAAQVATAVAAKINAYTELPLTAAVAAGTVTVTARNKGPEGNALYLAHNFGHTDATPAGLACVVTAMASGATNPDATDVITAIGSQPFYAIVQPWNDDANMIVWEAAMAARADASRMNYGIVYTHNPASYSGLTTAAGLRNSTFAPITGLASIPEPSWQVAGAVAAQVVASAVVNPARPAKTLVLKGITAPRVNLRFSDDERELLLAAGIATLDVNAAEQVYIERMITTSKTNANGYPDTGLKELTKILTYYAMSWSQQAMIIAKFPRHSLGDDGNTYRPDAFVVTPSVIKGEVIALGKDWYEAGWLENFEQFKADLVVDRDPNDKNRVNSLLRPNTPDPFNTMASVIQPVN